jgi:protein phosphatase
MRLHVGARTDVGRVRELNEDAYLTSIDACLFVVCDGMGGAPAGEVASDLAVRAIVEQFNGCAAGHDGVTDRRANQYLPQTSRLGRAIRRGNQIVYAHAQEDPRHNGMGTTVVAACIAKDIASIAHVGDSRAYLWHDDRLESLTRDHSLGEAQARAGMPADDSPASSEQRNVLLRVLGRAPDVDVELTEVPVRSGDYLLLCSDGLTRMVPEPAIEKTIVRLRQPQRIADHLIDAANDCGGADNTTVVVVEIGGRWWERLSHWWTGGVGS